MKYYSISLYVYDTERKESVFFKNVHVKGGEGLEAFFSGHTETYNTCRVTPETWEERVYDMMCNGCENEHHCHNACENCEEYEEALEGENV